MKYFVICKKANGRSKTEKVFASTESNIAAHGINFDLTSSQVRNLVAKASVMEFGEKCTEGYITMYCLDTEIITISNCRTSIILLCDGEPDSTLSDYSGYTAGLYAEDHGISQSEFSRFIGYVNEYKHYSQKLGNHTITGIYVAKEKMFLS